MPEFPRVIPSWSETPLTAQTKEKSLMHPGGGYKRYPTHTSKSFFAPIAWGGVFDPAIIDDMLAEVRGTDEYQEALKAARHSTEPIVSSSPNRLNELREHVAYMAQRHRQFIPPDVEELARLEAYEAAPTTDVLASAMPRRGS